MSETIEIRHDVLEAITIERDDAKAREMKLQAQLDGWAELLGISDFYWVPKEHPDRAAFKPFFNNLNDTGRRSALKESKFNKDGMERIKALEAELDRNRDQRRDLLRAVETMTSARDGLRAQIGRLEEAIDKLRPALEKAEDFVVTHAAQGDEQLLAVIGAALDRG